MPNNRRSTMAMVPTNNMMDITCADSVIAYIYSDSCSPMLQGVSANSVISPSSIDSPLVIYHPRLPFDYSNNLQGATEIVLPKQRSKAIISTDYTGPFRAVRQCSASKAKISIRSGSTSICCRLEEIANEFSH